MHISSHGTCFCIQKIYGIRTIFAYYRYFIRFYLDCLSSIVKTHIKPVIFLYIMTLPKTEKI